MEIYDHDSIFYVLPLSQQSQFVALFETAEQSSSEEKTSESGDETEIDDEAYGAEKDDDNSEGANSFSSFEEL